MYQYKSLDDTIVAISTAVGEGAVGMIRLSGQDALSIADKMFVAKGKIKPSQFKHFSVHYGWIEKKKDGQSHKIDEVLLTVMRAPNSYTKEDVVEISCHGGVVPLKAILSLALELGARLAEPGEFTKRAFLNGRIDLTQAEAVLDIIQAKTEAFLDISHNQLKGELSLELENMRTALMDIYTQIEAAVNFPEDDIDEKSKRELLKQIDGCVKRVGKLLASSDQGKILKEGIKIVLCGKPNVGKSSLLNALLKQPRAIVSHIAGTTRDTIEETAQIRGIPFQLVDTAGILEPRDLIEEEAIKRSRMSIGSADLVLLILDNSAPLDKEDERLIDHVKGKNVLAVINKSDLGPRLDEQKIKKLFPFSKTVRVSVLEKSGLENLEEAIVQEVWHSKNIDTHGILISNIRHIKALQECEEALKKSHEILSKGVSL